MYADVVFDVGEAWVISTLEITAEASSHPLGSNCDDVVTGDDRGRDAQIVTVSVVTGPAHQ